MPGVYVLTHTIAALVTAIVVEGDCNGWAIAMEGDRSGSTFHVHSSVYPAHAQRPRRQMDLNISSLTHTYLSYA